MSDSNFFTMDFDDKKYMAFVVDKESSMLSPPTLNVYLAGPLTNNDLCVDRTCCEVRKTVKRILESYEYQGIRFKVYDPADITSPGSDHTDEDVYDLDHERTMMADLVVFHVNVPSLGVGCECQISADASSPKVIIAKKGTRLSRMFAGVYSATLATIEYENLGDVETQLSENLLLIASKAVESAKHRRIIMQEFEDARLGRTIFRQRIVHRIPLEDLAMKTDTRPRWLWRLERIPSLMACCSPVRLRRIADIVQCCLQFRNSGTLELKPSGAPMNNEEIESLENLVDFALNRNNKYPGYPEDRAFRLWNEYQEGIQERAQFATVEHREGELQVVTIDEWRNRDCRLGLF